MNILLVTVAYPPEIRSASHIMQELAEELRDRYHTVSVVTTYPQYNLLEEEKEKNFKEVSVERGITVIRTKTPPVHKINFIARAIAQLLMPYLFFPKIKKYLSASIDVVIVYSPPLTLSAVGWMTKNKYGAKFILNVQDIFPQNAIDLGIIKNGLVRRFFELIEHKAYDNADNIAVHSDGNMEFLSKVKQVPGHKLQVLHNWIDIRPYANSNRNGRFRKTYGLENNFIILFAGVIGPSQGLDLIIKVAHELQDISDICFLMVGDGTEKGRLIKMTEDLNLKNVVFKPFVSKEEYPLLVKESNVGLVCLNSKNKTPVVPGKILGYMASSVPIVAFVNKESDTHAIIRAAACGYSEKSGDVQKAVNVLRQLYSERDNLREYGANGFKYVSQNFSKQVCIDRLEKLF